MRKTVYAGETNPLMLDTSIPPSALRRLITKFPGFTNLYDEISPAGFTTSLSCSSL